MSLSSHNSGTVYHIFHHHLSPIHKWVGFSRHATLLLITIVFVTTDSRITSPRPSVTSKMSRKRALSHSPFSEYGLDIESLTRSSEGSLQLPFAHSNSRSSSAASGSYGHLSAGNRTRNNQLSRKSDKMNANTGNVTMTTFCKRDPVLHENW